MMNKISKIIFSLVISVVTLLPVYGFSLSYEVLDLGEGEINRTPYVWGFEDDEFLSNNAGEVFKMDSEDRNQFTIFHKDKSTQTVTIPELEGKSVTIYGFSNEVVMGTFYCDESCTLHSPEETPYYKQHLFAYYHKENKFVDLRVEAEKAGFKLFPLDDDWAYEIFINDTGALAGEFVVDGTVDSNWEKSLFFYSPETGMKQLAVDGLSSHMTYEPRQLNNKGQLIFSSNLFNPEKDKPDSKFYLFDRDAGVKELEGLNDFLSHYESYDFYGLSDLGNLLIRGRRESDQGSSVELFFYNTANGKTERIDEGDFKMKLFYNSIDKSSFNKNGQAAFLATRKDKAGKQISLILWSPNSEEVTTSLPPDFNNSTIDRHGLDNKGRIFASYEDELFIWDEKGGIQWMKDLIASEIKFDFEDIEEIIVNRDGSILAEAEVPGEEEDDTHVILLVPRE